MTAVILEDIQSLKQEIARLQEIAYIDTLTGLLNRRALDEKLHDEYERAKRNHSAIALLFLDLNGFKQINDIQGHEEGDRVLKSVANALKSIPLRTYDFVARYAGDEFIVVLPDATIHGAKRIAEQVKKLVSVSGVTTAIGVAACVPAVKSEYKSLIAAADSQMYEDKRSG